MPEKVLFIGIDGAEPNLINKWCNVGALPALQSFRSDGLSSAMTSPPALGSDAMWTSFYTSVHAGRHGRYFYRQYDSKTYQSVLYKSHDDKPEPFWNAISRANRRVAVIDVPYAPLTKSINGIQIVDWRTHDREGPPLITWPPALASEVSAQYGMDTLGQRDRHGRSSAVFRTLRDDLLESVQRKAELTCKIFEQEDWDLFMVVFGEPHDAGHTFWHCHDPAHPDHDAEWVRKYGNPIKDIYVAIDAAIGRLLERVSPDMTVIIYAGIGMGPNYTGNYMLDDILRALELGQVPSTRPVDRLRSIWRIMPSGVRNHFRRLASGMDESLLARGRSRRKYFAIPHNEYSGAIRLNVVGRDPNGLVKPGTEYRALIEALTQDLLDIVNVGTGTPIVKEVLHTPDFYSGDHIDEFPDLFVVWRKDEPHSSVWSPKIGEVTRTYPGSRSGDHSNRCQLFAQGPAIEAGQLNHAVSIMDLGSTIAMRLGVALPGVDGKSIAAILR